MEKILFLFILSFLLVYANASQIIISSNFRTIFLNASIYSPNDTVVFAANASNNTLDCRGFSISSSNVAVLFSNFSYNNTLLNCSINGAVLSLHGAMNNLINATGNYSLNFSDNSSNVALGNFFRLVLLSTNETNYTIGRFIQIMPKALALKAPYVVAMNIKMKDFLAAAESHNITLPRFGAYPNSSCNYSCNYKIESMQVYKNKKISFNPYYFDTPYWGYDILADATFNVTPNASYTYKPTYIKPWIYQYEIFPQNKPVYWNYTIVFHSPTAWNKLRLLNGWQGDPNATLAAEFYNISSGLFSFKVGVQKPGVYEFIAILNDPFEHENSTTETYSVGLSFCGDNGTITKPGYYPFAYNTLRPISVFWFQNYACKTGINVGSSNVSIDCRGGYLNTKNVDVSINGYKNVSISNCFLYGNGINAVGAEINISNTTFISNSANDLGIYALNSQIEISNSRFIGYKNSILGLNSSITFIGNATSTGVVSSINSTNNEAKNAVKSFAEPQASYINPKILITLFLIEGFTIAIVVILYEIMSWLYDSKYRS